MSLGLFSLEEASLLVIRSKQNAVFKALMQTGKKGLYESSFMAEGLRLVTTVLEQGVSAELLLVSERFAEKQAEDLSELRELCPDAIETVCFADDLFNRLAGTKTPQGVILVARRPEPADFTRLRGSKRLMVLDRVQDPGNVGTLIRLAAALAFDGLILLRGSADPYDEKVLRSTMGTGFKLGLVTDVSWAEASVWLREAGFTIYVADMGGTAASKTSFRKQAALVLGNEGNGVSEDVLADADQVVSIPLAAGVESLNVAIAGAIISYEMQREED